MYRLNSDEMFYDIADGQAVVINFVNGMYYGFSMLGSAVLNRLLEGQTPDAILAVLQKVPNAPEDIGKSLDTFIDQLKEKGIIVEGDSADADDTPFDDVSLSDGFDLNIDEFAEVENLILADPIHEVDVTQGWPMVNVD